MAGYAKRVLKETYGLQVEEFINLYRREYKDSSKIGAYSYLEDGIYTDYSCRDRVNYLGFVIVEKSIIKLEVSCIGLDRHGEHEAALIAKDTFLRVFCDHAETCRRLEVNYVCRNLNPAHRVAKHRIGFLDRASLIRRLYEEC